MTVISPRTVGVQYAGEITSERMKRLDQSGNDAQLQMWLVMEVKSDAIENNILKEPGVLGP